MHTRITNAVLSCLIPLLVACAGGDTTTSNGSGSSGSNTGGVTTGGATSTGGAGTTGHLVPEIVAIIQGTLAADLATSVTAHDQIVSQIQPGAEDAGDDGHHVYVPYGAEDAGTPQWLAVDDWTSLAGAQATYSSPQFGQAFSTFFSGPPTVTLWTAAPGFTSYNLPVPAGAVLHTVLVQGQLGFPLEQAEAAHNGIVGQIGAAAQDAGDLYHQAYLFTQADGGIFLLNFDVWDTDAVFAFYDNPALAAGFANVYADGGPSLTIYDSLPASWTQWGTSQLP